MLSLSTLLVVSGWLRISSEDTVYISIASSPMDYQCSLYHQIKSVVSLSPIRLETQFWKPQNQLRKLIYAFCCSRTALGTEGWISQGSPEEL